MKKLLSRVYIHSARAIHCFILWRVTIKSNLQVTLEISRNTQS